VSERGFLLFVGLLFCKDHQLLLVHLGTREGEPCVGTRSWGWILKETKIKVDKGVSKGLLISLFCFTACNLWVCMCSEGLEIVKLKVSVLMCLFG
jgi:hypothetical protein